MDEAAIVGTINVALSQLDYIDPIMGYELRGACATRPIKLDVVRTLRDECGKRAWALKEGPLRHAWFNASDALFSLCRTVGRSKIPTEQE